MSAIKINQERVDALENRIDHDKIRKAKGERAGEIVNNSILPLFESKLRAGMSEKRFSLLEPVFGKVLTGELQAPEVSLSRIERNLRGDQSAIHVLKHTEALVQVAQGIPESLREASVEKIWKEVEPIAEAIIKDLGGKKIKIKV